MARENRVFAHPAAEDGIEKGFRIARPRACHVVSTTGRRVQARILGTAKENAPRHSRRLLGQALGKQFLINIATSIWTRERAQDGSTATRTAPLARLFV